METPDLLYGSFAKQIYLDMYRLAGPYLDTRQNDLHTRISYSFALKILEAEGGDERIVIPAILLHDVGWKMVPEDLQLKAFGPGTYNAELNRIHEVEGAKKAGEILESLNYEPQLIDEVVSIIDGHDSRLEALSINDAIVKDSDKLWRFTPEALEIDSKRFNIDPRVHVEWLATKIDGWFFTKSAISMAKEQNRLSSMTLAS